MPFNLGRGKKTRQEEEGEQPSDEAADELADPAAPEPGVEEEAEIVEETEIAPEVESEPEREPVQQQRAEKGGRDREPAEPFSFRPSFLDDAEPTDRPQAKRTNVAASPAPRGGPFFVAVRDEKGNVSTQRFDERKDAEAHIELLLEDGVDAGTIVVHRGLEIGFQITKRPVVQFVSPEQP